MDKFGKTFRKTMIENYYRLLSVANLTVKVTIPTAEKMSEYIQKSIKLQEQEKGLEMGISDKIKKSIHNGILYGDEITRKPLNDLGEYLDQSVLETEKKLKEEYDINTNQWMFSVENLEMLEKIYSLADLIFQDIQHISKYNSIRYLTTWSMLQHLYLTSQEKRLDGKVKQLEIKDNIKLQELREIQEKCLYYCILSNGTYGKGSDLRNIIKVSDFSKDFLTHTKLEETDILYSFWETVPYKPAYVITKDKIRKSIVLCIRGTQHWTDIITDLDAHYLSFSIVKDPGSNKLFIKFNYDESQDYLRKRIGDDTRELNGESFRLLTGKEEVLETGYAHAGMLVSAIGAYKEITPKLEEVLSNPGHKDYNLVITGHSLGGGISTLMTLLYVIHPLKVFKERTYEKLSGYSYGGASVLSLDFEKYMKDIMQNVVLGYDIVPRLSFGSIRDLCKIMLAFDEINKNNSSLFSEVLGIGLIGEDYAKVGKEPRSKMGEFKKLYEQFKYHHMDSLKLFPMGKVYHIQDYKSNPIKKRVGSFDFVLREVSKKDYFDEIIFSTQMVKHHFSESYEECLLPQKTLYHTYPLQTLTKNSLMTFDKS